MKKKLLSALALAALLAVASTPSEIAAKWGGAVLQATIRVVAIGPFFDHNG